MTTANEMWGPERLKRINGDPALLSLLYDLNLLPEVVLANIRAARIDERERLRKWAQEQARSHQQLTVEAYDAKDERNGDIHNALTSSYLRLADEITKAQITEGSKTK
jgi:hypothetical protein